MENSFESNLGFLKEDVIKRADLIIGGATDYIIRNEETKFLKVSEIALKVLQYLFPKREEFWTDKELVEIAEKIVMERIKNKGNSKMDSIKNNNTIRSGAFNRMHILDEVRRSREEETE